MKIKHRKHSKWRRGETQSEDTRDTQVTQMHKIMKKWNELPEQKRFNLPKENGGEDKRRNRL